MGYMLSCREEGGYRNEAITVFFVFLRSNLPVLYVAVKKNLGIGGAVGLGESEEATVAVATICICVICICVFPLLIEKHIGEWALGGWRSVRKEARLEWQRVLFTYFLFCFVFLYAFFIFSLLLCHE